MLLLMAMVIYHFISYLDRLFYSFSDEILSDVHDNRNNNLTLTVPVIATLLTKWHNYWIVGYHNDNK